MTRPAAIAAIIFPFAALTSVTACSDDKDEEPVACTTYFAEESETGDLNHQPTCLDADGNEQKVASGSSSCGDTRLFYNDYGYGVQGEPWHTDAAGAAIGEGTSLDAAIAECADK